MRKSYKMKNIYNIYHWTFELKKIWTSRTIKQKKLVEFLSKWIFLTIELFKLTEQSGLKEKTVIH